MSLNQKLWRMANCSRRSWWTRQSPQSICQNSYLFGIPHPTGPVWSNENHWNALHLNHVRQINSGEQKNRWQCSMYSFHSKIPVHKLHSFFNLRRKKQKNKKKEVHFWCTEGKVTGEEFTSGVLYLWQVLEYQSPIVYSWNVQGGQGWNLSSARIWPTPPLTVTRLLFRPWWWMCANDIVVRVDLNKMTFQVGYSNVAETGKSPKVPGCLSVDETDNQDPCNDRVSGSSFQLNKLAFTLAILQKRARKDFKL